MRLTPLANNGTPSFSSAPRPSTFIQAILILPFRHSPATAIWQSNLPCGRPKRVTRGQAAHARRAGGGTSGKTGQGQGALDVLRILRAIRTRTLAAGLQRLQADSIAADVTREAIAHLATLLGSASAAGTQMVIRATERLEDPTEMALSCELLARELSEALRI